MDLYVWGKLLTLHRRGYGVDVESPLWSMPPPAELRNRPQDGISWIQKVTVGFTKHFYIIFGTNLLTGGPAQNCCFLPILGVRRKRISNGVQTEWNLRDRDFWNEHVPEDLDPTSGHQLGGHEVGGRALHPRGPPCCSTAVLLPPIYTYVPPNDQIWSQKPNSTAATFCIHEIPSWGLFRSSAGGGIHHGGLLHQHHGPSDEVWVVYLRPTGP